MTATLGSDVVGEVARLAARSTRPRAGAARAQTPSAQRSRSRQTTKWAYGSGRSASLRNTQNSLPSGSAIVTHPLPSGSR
jgi:hypothetical protein